MSISKTIIISCAGMGNRLGVGTTKALVEVEGKPLIIRHLEMLDNIDDVRVVIGFQAERVIDVVCKYRKDILFVFNHNYQNNGTGASVSLAMEHGHDYILSLDGDLLVHPNDMDVILSKEGEFIGGTEPETEDTWYVKTFLKNGMEYVSAFSHKNGDYEWTGIVQVERDKIQPGSEHVFQLLEPVLPIPLLKVKTREIDTIEDYEKAVEWVKSNYGDK